MDLNYWKDEVHGLAVEKGWWEPRPSVEVVVCNLHGELSEAWEEYRAAQSVEELFSLRYRDDGKPEGFMIEIADFMIRVLDACGGYEIDLSFFEQDVSDFRMPRKFNSANALSLIPKYIKDMHSQAGLFLSMMKHYDYDGCCGCPAYNKHVASEAFASLNIAYRLLGRIIELDMFNWVIDQNIGHPGDIIRIKHEYNKTRPYRHGGKRA